MLYTGKSCREPPQVGLVKTEVCISGWNSTCQPYIDSATTLSDYEEPHDFQFLSDCGKALPALSRCHICECRVEIKCSVLVSACVLYTCLSQEK